MACTLYSVARNLRSAAARCVRLEDPQVLQLAELRRDCARAALAERVVAELQLLQRRPAAELRGEPTW